MWDQSAFNQSAGGFIEGINQIQSPGKRDENRRMQSVVPLVARQIKSCSEDEFKLFGFPVQIVHIVGVLRKFDVQSTKANCVIEDHTGEVNAILWLREENDTDGVSNIPNVKEGGYVQIFGSIRQQEGGKIIMILKMFPVEDCNVITTHLLEAVHTRLAAEAASKGATPGVLKTPRSALATSMSSMDVSSMPMGGICSNSIGLNKMQERVFAILQACTSDHGLNRRTILSHFAPNQEREVNDALEFLVNEGHTYSTLDNDHFRATDSL